MKTWTVTFMVQGKKEERVLLSKDSLARFLTKLTLDWGITEWKVKRS